jgi:pimeloyl-ACP methyl ester carboxylesterase
VEKYKENYELHLVTIKGFGNKEKAEVEHYLREVKDEVVAYTKEHDLKNPILVGHSMGGFLGLWAAADLRTFKKLNCWLQKRHIILYSMMNRNGFILI